MTVDYTPRSAEQTNGLGLAGFIISLVGICSGGLLSPIGLILSLVALGREPKGFAIAGVVIGALGSCGIILTLVFVPVVILGVLVAAGATAAAVGLAAAIGGPSLEATIEMMALTAKIERYQHETGALPASLLDLPDIDPSSGLLTDPWGKAYLFEVSPDGRTYRLVSAGPDATMGTGDDIVIDRGGGSWPGTPPATPETTPDADPPENEPPPEGESR